MTTSRANPLTFQAPVALTARKSPQLLRPSAQSRTRRNPRTTSPTMADLTLYSVPVSNYAARVRFLVYRKQLEQNVKIEAPSQLGGLKSDQYLAINPLGKMPALIVHAPQHDDASPTVLYESSVMCEYIAERYADRGASFIPEQPEHRARARMIANVLDLYVGPHHPFMYRKVDGDRVQGVQEIKKGLDVVESILSEDGPYAIGKQLTIADCCLWGSWPFYEYMLPTFFSWNPVDDRPKLKAWVQHMKQESEAAKKVYNEVHAGLVGWYDGGRWENLGMQPVNPPQNLFL